MLLVAAIGLLIWTHKRRSPSTPWIFYCPVAILLLSFVQFENSLSGFQICWYLVLAHAGRRFLFFLDSPRFGWPLLAWAMAAAVVRKLLGRAWPIHLARGFAAPLPAPALPSLSPDVARGRGSDHGGFLLSPRGVLVRRVLHQYLLRPPTSGPGRQVLLPGHRRRGGRVDPVAAPVGWSTTSRQVSGAALLLGVVIVVIAAWVVFEISRQDEEDPSPIGVALIAFGVLFALSIATGRSTLIGLWYTGTSRYTTFDLLILVGTYLALVGRRNVPAHEHPHLNSGDGAENQPFRSTVARIFRTRDRKVSIILGASLAVIICVQVVLGLLSGLAGGRSTHQVGLSTEDVIANINQAPDSVVYRIYWGASVSYVRQYAPVVERLRLTFLDSTAGSLTSQREGLDVGVWEGGTTSPVSPWRGLRDGEVVSLNAPHFSVRSARPPTVSECNANALVDPKACATTGTVTVIPRADGSIHTPFTVTTGAVRIGTERARRARPVTSRCRALTIRPCNPSRK